ncbi:MAG: AMP-binding protein [Verrucomicrobiota bacterium]|nr:AMP-binding protein [Verrucomicrobiota bacterium]
MIFWKLIAWIGRRILSLRYRVEIKGFKELATLQDAKKPGVLFLPNHTAYIEPILLFLLLWPRFRMRPLVVEYVFRQPLVRPFMRLVKALPIPNFETAVNQIKLKKAERSIGEISSKLKEGDNFLLYPSGRLKNGAKEIIGGASGTHALLEECPDARVVLIRTTGLWGSMFSRAIEGRSPDIRQTFWKGFKVLLKNGIFFSPRRKLTLEFEIAGNDFPRKASRLELNRYLESWYNRYPDAEGRRLEGEPLQLISYSCWREELLEPYQHKKKKLNNNGAQISTNTRHQIYAEIRRILDNPKVAIEDEMNLSLDLGMDSLNIAELVGFLSHHYEVPEIHPEELDTVRSALEIGEGARAVERTIDQSSQHSFPDEKGRPGPALPVGKTLAEAFLNSADRMSSFVACGDNVSGVLTYKKLKRSALVLAEYFRGLEAKTVAVLLPASVGAYVTVLALQLAGKVPVMLNWTLGVRYLEEMIRMSGATEVISSWRFLERLSHVEFGTLVDKMKLLEDIREGLSLKTKLRGLFLSFRSAPSLMSKLHLNDVDEHSPAVILFTSGTEAVPKGVPLSHKNILSNLRSGMQCIEVKADDVIFGILPPFHSFGFSVAGIFSFLCGVRIAMYPDPTDGFALAEGIDRWKVTLFCSAPSFMKGLFQAAKPNQLQSIRLFVTGAEKAPQELYEKAKALVPTAKMIEGYGITECSPILTLNRLNLPPKGVGQPLPDVEMCTVHPETHELLPPGSEGEICVRGPNVFNGYLGNPRSPFLEMHGKKWYLTGDLGRLDPDGNLILSGRLKRFTKIGGEMISLSAVEEAIASELKQRGVISAEFPSLAICADERVVGKTQLVLFATIDLQREEVNELLKNAGFSRLIKVSAVQKVDVIPLMGTGKTDYRKLQASFPS